jgi:hypothetical protein
MPALDRCHPIVVRALEKDGWTVAPRQQELYVSKRHILQIDIKATRQQNGTSRSLLFVEVKCFANRGDETTDLYIALGQYLVYRSLLKQKNIQADLYLAVPITAYESVFKRMGRAAVSENRIKMIVVDLEGEVITQWLE